jgi:hypothetical protein
MSNANPDIINFIGTDQIDKVVYSPVPRLSVTNSGATSSSPQSAFIVTTAIENPYKKKCFVRYKWTTNGGTNWNNADGRELYTYTYTFTPGPFSSVLGGLRAAASVGADDNYIYFRTANGLHGDVSDDGISITYSPTSLIFDFQYALFEVL